MKNIKTITNSYFLFVALVVLLLNAGLSWAEGSKDLYPKGVKGRRAALTVNGVATASIPFATKGTHFVYAKEGEVITLASSIQGLNKDNTNKITLTKPDNTLAELNYEVGNKIIGFISNRNSELAGPAKPDEGQTAGGSNKYIPIYYTVPVGGTGIYKVEFLGGTSRSNGSAFVADENWNQVSNSYLIHAWDISVLDTNKQWRQGRVYNTVVNMEVEISSKTGFYGQFKVLTRDGYVYNVDNNGNNGYVFTFMVNNRGFHKIDDSDVPSYKSIKANKYTDVTTRYQDPRIEDQGATVTQKIFYNIPDHTMPSESIGAVPGNKTWLFSRPKEISVKDIEVKGIEGSINRIGNKGASIQFYNESGGDYVIEIKSANGESSSFVPLKLEGVSKIGHNSVFWDGKDGNGNIIEPGLSDVTISLRLRGAEVHFPFIDVEFNTNGLKLELLSINYDDADPSTTTTTISDRIYWNDSDIRTGPNVAGYFSNPINVSHLIDIEGVPSTGNNANGHTWGGGTQSTSGTFGDEQGMDTWTFIQGETITKNFVVEKIEADLYTDIDWKITNVTKATYGAVGEEVTYIVTAGSKLGSGDVLADSLTNKRGAPFTFTVPIGLKIIGEPIMEFGNCGISESVSLSYNETTRTYYSELSIPGGCSMTYTFKAELTGVMGDKVAEATILRPADVIDPDATNNDEDTLPTNPYYECYNNDILGNVTGSIACNNISEASFMVLDNCSAEVLYYENFDTVFWNVNSGRSVWSKRQAVSFEDGLPKISTNNYVREGIIGGATTSYLFAPGKDDPSYTVTGDDSQSIARIKNGYYAVTSPGYVQMGIPSDDPWSSQIWSPNNPEGSYDWTPAWDNVDHDPIRDASGAINGGAFHIRGAISAVESIKPFYEINLEKSLKVGEVYKVSLNSYVTYHDKEYMLVDVIDQDTGFVYASIPLTYKGGGLPEGSSPSGFSLGWVPLEAIFSFNESHCKLDANKNIRIEIRGSQNRALVSGKGFGHTIIDDVSFASLTNEGPCTDNVQLVNCDTSCFEDVDGAGAQWYYKKDELVDNTFKEFEIIQPATNGGFVFDIYRLDNSFNLIINGVPLYGPTKDSQIQFEGGRPILANIRFKSDGKLWNHATKPGEIPPGNEVSYIWLLNDNVDNFDFEDRFKNPTPAIRVVIDEWGNTRLYGKRRTNTTVLEELEFFEKKNGKDVIVYPNIVHWNAEEYEDEDGNKVGNVVEVRQQVLQFTSMAFIGYGMNKKDCESYSLEKKGTFSDENNDGYAIAGETIEYFFEVKNAGDMSIYDIEIKDALFGNDFIIKVETDSLGNAQVSPNNVILENDINDDGVLGRNETWTIRVKYTLTNDDIFTNKGVYNIAEVKGTGVLDSDPSKVYSFDSVSSKDGNSYDQIPDYEKPTGFEEHTFVPLKGGGLLITNPMIYQRMK